MSSSGNMRRQLLQEAVKNATRSSVEADTHRNLTTEAFYLNEQWSQSYIAFGINDYLRKAYDRPDEVFVTMETSIGWLKGFVEQHSVQDNDVDRLRFDLTVWSKGQSVAGLLEIKDRPVMSRAQLLADPGRLCQALENWKSLRWGMFVFSVRLKKYDEVASNLQLLRARAKAQLDVIAEEFPSHFDQFFIPKCVESPDVALIWVGVLFKQSKGD